jgi:hypothetical protein
MRRLGLVGSLVLFVSLYLAGSIPAFSADNGIVAATVTVQDVPCITVGTTNINYGQKAFSTLLTPVSALSSIANVDSCSTAAQTLLATGSQATAAGALWNPVASFSCSGPSTNEYRHTLRDADTATDVHLSLVAQTLASLTGMSRQSSTPRS